MTQTPEQSPVNAEHLRDYSQLRRSVTDRKIAGVAGGLGRHLNIDPTVIRVVLVVLCLFGGAGFLIYAAAWLLVPEEGKDQAPVSVNAATRNTVLIVVGVIAALLVIGDSWGGIGFPWPLVLIGVAVLLYLIFREQQMTNGAQQSAPQPGHPTPAAPAAAHPASPAAEEGTESTMAYGGPPPWAPPAGPTYQPPASRRGPVLFWATLALIAIALGTLGLFDVAGVPVTDAAYPALALTVTALMLLVGAWYGRAGGLVALGVVTALVLAAVSLGDPGYNGPRNPAITPTSATQVEDRYFVPAGAIDLDLSNIRDIERLDGRTIEVRANAGELRVTLPEGVDTLVDAEITGAGQAAIEGQVSDGTDVRLTRMIDGGADAPEIELDLHLFVGSIEVNQA